MRFIDANVFLYAILTPNRELNERELELKNTSKTIFKKVSPLCNLFLE